MKCQDLLNILGDYIDGDIEPGICEEFEQHMKGCNPCQVVVDNIRKTITLYKEGKPLEIPTDFRNKLHNTLRSQWKESNKEDE